MLLDQKSYRESSNKKPHIIDSPKLERMPGQANIFNIRDSALSIMTDNHSEEFRIIVSTLKKHPQINSIRFIILESVKDYEDIDELKDKVWINLYQTKKRLQGYGSYIIARQEFEMLQSAFTQINFQQESKDEKQLNTTNLPI